MDRSERPLTSADPERQRASARCPSKVVLISERLTAARTRGIHSATQARRARRKIDPAVISAYGRTSADPAGSLPLGIVAGQGALAPMDADASLPLGAGRCRFRFGLGGAA
jgi:hypothetical protein